MAFRFVMEDYRRVQARIALIDDRSQELASLYSWLQRDDELRGRVNSVAAQVKPGDMGGAAEMLTVALGSGGAVAAFGRTINAWLSTRRAKIKIEIVNGDIAQRVEIDAAHADAAARLVREAYEAMGGQP